MTHELRSRHTADWIEYRVQMADETLRFTFTEASPFTVGDGVTVTSTDNAVFIGEIVELDPDTGLAHVSLS